MSNDKKQQKVWREDFADKLEKKFGLSATRGKVQQIILRN